MVFLSNSESAAILDVSKGEKQNAPFQFLKNEKLINEYFCIKRGIYWCDINSLKDRQSNK